VGGHGRSTYQPDQEDEVGQQVKAILDGRSDGAAEGPWEGEMTASRYRAHTECPT